MTSIDIDRRRDEVYTTVMNVRNTAVSQKLEDVQAAIEQAESIDITGSRPQLEEALSSQLKLRDVIDSLMAVREEAERNISAIRRVLELLEEPTATTSATRIAGTTLSDQAVWQQAEVALRDIGRFAKPKDIAEKIRALGGDPGKQAVSGISNGANDHPEKFTRRGKRGAYEFGLVEWEEKDGGKARD